MLEFRGAARASACASARSAPGLKSVPTTIHRLLGVAGSTCRSLRAPRLSGRGSGVKTASTLRPRSPWYARARAAQQRVAVLSFPPFQLDPADERLWRDGRELRLRRKPFAILRYLAENP